MRARVLEHEVGGGGGDTVVLVPGGLTGIRSLDPIAVGLADRGFRTVAVEPIPNALGGRGEAGDPSYDGDVERESLRLTIEEVGGGSVHLLGWSNGGRAALDYAARHDVRSVVAVEPAAFWLVDDPGARELEDLLRGSAGGEISDDVLVAFLENVRVVPPGTDLRALPQWEAWRGVRNALSWYGDAVYDTVTQLEVEAIDVPVLLARGTWTAPWLRAAVDVLAGRLPDVRVLDLEGGHACLLQSVDDFLDAAEQHLRAASA